MNVLVIASDEYLTLRLLKCLAALNAVVHVIGVGAAVRASRYCRRYTAYDLSTLRHSSAQVCDDIDRYCRLHAIDIVLPSGMESVFLLAGLKDSFKSTRVLPRAAVEHLRVLNNKWDFARLLKQHGLPEPQSHLLERVEDVDALDIGFPVILKPLELDASRGVVRCDTPAAVQAHLKRPGVTLPLLVQEYVPGADVGLGLLAHQGTVVAWSIQKQLPDGSGVEFIKHERILEIGRRILSVCRHDGIAHFDMRIDARDGSIQVLECNPRFWASLPFCMLAGVNFADLAIRLALDEPLPESAYQTLSVTFPTKALSGVLSGGILEWGLSKPSRQALGFTLSDPLPQVCLGAGRLRRKMETLFTRKPATIAGQTRGH